MSSLVSVRRLTSADVDAFQRLRLEGFSSEDHAFRVAPEDEAKVSLVEARARLDKEFVVGAYDGGTLVGIAGLRRLSGAKLDHKALLWGMYLRPAFRGAGAADGLMSALLDEARGTVEIVTLTVVASNARAVRFYERWGFRTYGIEPQSIRLADGTYLDEALMFLRVR